MSISQVPKYVGAGGWKSNHSLSIGFSSHLSWWVPFSLESDEICIDRKTGNIGLELKSNQFFSLIFSNCNMSGSHWNVRGQRGHKVFDGADAVVTCSAGVTFIQTRIWRDHYGKWQSGNHTLYVQLSIAITSPNLDDRHITYYQFSGWSDYVDAVWLILHTGSFL